MLTPCKIQKEKKMNRKQYGTYAEYLTIVKLLGLGFEVFTPIGDNSKADLICLVDNFPLKIQVKSQIKSKDKATAMFMTDSRACQTKNRHGYSVAEVDCFIFVDITRNKFFILKNKEDLGKNFKIRYAPTKNKQHKFVNNASEFELCVETLHEITKSAKADMLKTKSGLQCENDVVK